MPLRLLLAKFLSSTYGIMSWRRQKSWAWPTAQATCKATSSSGTKNWLRSMEGQPKWATGSVRRGWRPERALPSTKVWKFTSFGPLKEWGSKGSFLPYRNVLEYELVWAELCVLMRVRVCVLKGQGNLNLKWNCDTVFFHCSSKTLSDSYHKMARPSIKKARWLEGIIEPDLNHSVI